jgi:hypothetical protein
MRSEVWSECGASARARNPSDVLNDQELSSKTALESPTGNQELSGVSQNAESVLPLFASDDAIATALLGLERVDEFKQILPLLEANASIFGKPCGGDAQNWNSCGTAA